jgi:hypothetical protein
LKVITNTIAAVLLASTAALADTIPTIENEIAWRSFQANPNCIATFQDNEVLIICSDKSWSQSYLYSKPIVTVNIGEGKFSRFVLLEGKLYLLSDPVTILKENTLTGR